MRPLTRGSSLSPVTCLLVLPLLCGGNDGLFASDQDSGPDAKRCSKKSCGATMTLAACSPAGEDARDVQCWRCEVVDWSRNKTHRDEEQIVRRGDSGRRIEVASLAGGFVRASQPTAFGSVASVQSGTGTGSNESLEPSQRWEWQLERGLRDPRVPVPEPEPDRITISPAYQTHWGEWEWNTTFVVQQSWPDAEQRRSALAQHTVFCVAENIERTTLVPEPHPMEHDVFHRTRISIGYLYRFPQSRLGLGFSGTAYLLPRPVEQSAARLPLGVVVFTRLSL